MLPNQHTSPRSVDFEVEYTARFPEILHTLNCSLLISTYQAGKVIVVGVHDGQLQVSYLDFPAAMGVAISNQCIAVGSGRQVHFIYPAHELLETHYRDQQFDAIYVSRSSVYTGKIDSHELSWGSDGLWLVNTLFSAICTLQSNSLFTPRWTPPFIQAIGEHDCCHLNGLALREGIPAFTSMLAATSTPSGWRAHKLDGGCIFSVSDNAIVCDRLCMPHSPRWYDNRLWALNSGAGQLGHIELNAHRFQPIETFPGFVRGLSFVSGHAFVGLSRGRETNLFGGLPITQSPHSMRCGVGIFDLTSGKTVAVLQFHTGVDEIFAVEALVGHRNPLFGGSWQYGQEREIWLME